MGILISAITDYLGLVFSLWLALYLLARGYANRLVLRASLALLAVSAYYLAAFARSSGALHTAGFFPAASIVAALMPLHNLSHYLLTPAQQATYTWLRRGVNAGGLASLGILLGVPPPALTHPQWISPFPLDSPAALAGAFQAFASLAILYNLWQVRRHRVFVLNQSFYAALAFGAAVVLYGVAGAVFNLTLPRPPATIMLLGGLVLLGYSAARYQALVIRRTLPNDFLLTTAFAFSLAALYILAAHPLGATVFQSGLAGVLALASHTAYDVFRTQLQRRQERRARSLRGELRTTLRPSALPPDTLRRALAILCHSLQASSGFIARRRGDEYTLAAALHTPLTELPAAELTLDERRAPAGSLARQFAWLVPIFDHEEQTGVIALGARTGLRDYEPEDLDWLEDAAEQISLLWQTDGAGFTGTRPPAEGAPPAADLFAALALKPDADLLAAVEEAFRHLHEYPFLGSSPLAGSFAINRGTHIERGKAVQQHLLALLDLLRPPGPRPPEPLPREWHPYAILHDAYAEGVPTREIMARLYISEGTFFRTRRSALRGIARAILESRPPQN